MMDVYYTPRKYVVY